jgi:hypothetical protein
MRAGYGMAHGRQWLDNSTSMALMLIALQRETSARKLAISPVI